MTVVMKTNLALIIAMVMNTVKRRSFLPGVTTLSRDLDRRPILGASNHYYLCYYCVKSFIAGLRKNTGKHFIGFYLLKQKVPVIIPKILQDMI